MLVGQVVLARQRPIEVHAIVQSRPGVGKAPLGRLFIDRGSGIITAVCVLLQALPDRYQVVFQFSQCINMYVKRRNRKSSQVTSAPPRSSPPSGSSAL
jgi:hypothetical protein